MSGPIDLRSDTITRPTPEMRRAIAEAEVGDDVFRDDPTVAKLEEKVAALLGKEAALFVASGTMGNQIALSVLTRPGDEVLLEGESHIYLYEAGAPAALSGLQIRTIPGVRGLVDAERLRAALRPRDVHYPPTTLFCFENTHNRAGGRVLPLEEMERTAGVAREAGLALHLDGARLWNAAIASETPEAAYASLCETVSVCFSKGLGAPVGSALAGERDRIERARQVRKRLGGGMRQVGILAAGALHAIEHHRDRLADDHRRARRLAETLAELSPFTLDPDSVETNIVVIGLRTGSPGEWCEKLATEGVRVVPFGERAIRAVLHLDVDDAGLKRAIEAFARCARGG
ncbi:MAG: aminotransferase class I/II-fold pyridoxal phosphate-dependent enzyme [Candidatus Eisenbacteria bacterium]|nr:aminotransferase class I/II-fold pyridoxal phosphate-dependent enzyme [Candidatus Latescibacterota bacterium]MBD3302434.1 aminotransferase class I/II-fold pyridoxal phosphate-dependent enzyme [Candidatus Eisenbacteria bacterium]